MLAPSVATREGGVDDVDLARRPDRPVDGAHGRGAPARHVDGDPRLVHELPGGAGVERARVDVLDGVVRLGGIARVDERRAVVHEPRDEDLPLVRPAVERDPGVIARESIHHARLSSLRRRIAATERIRAASRRASKGRDQAAPERAAPKSDHRPPRKRTLCVKQAVPARGTVERGSRLGVMTGRMKPLRPRRESADGECSPTSSAALADRDHRRALIQAVYPKWVRHSFMKDARRVYVHRRAALGSVPADRLMAAIGCVDLERPSPAMS